MLTRRSKLRLAIAAILAATLATQPALAQSVLRDAETEAFFRDMARPLATAAKLDPRSVQVLLIGDPSINAFAAEGQNVFINSGTIVAADSADQLQGVLAHELGHIANGDSISTDAAIGRAGRITILSLLLGVAAIAAGAGAAGAGILGAGQTAAEGKFLAFSRDQEAKADNSGAAYMRAVGISGRGELDFFKKLLNEETRLAIPQDDPYVRDHPLTEDRIENMQAVFEASPAWNTPPDPVFEARFQRIKAKLVGFVEEPRRVYQLYPPTDTSVPARYARVYAYHKQAFTDKAVAEVDALLKTAPTDPYFNEIKGQVLLESGKPVDAIPPLRIAFAQSHNPLIAALLGHALISTENPKDNDEAKTILKQAVARDNQNPFAWYQLGVVYERAGDEPRASLAMAEQAQLSGEKSRALMAARHAMEGLPVGSPDWIRAQDIVMVSQTGKKKKGRS
jgi:predicted Zn-dependent protease